MRRRDFLLATGALLACDNKLTSGSGGPCTTPASGAGLGYCLVDKKELRVPGAAQLKAGEVVLFNVDDNSAAIVARDAHGFYAMSAICSHACCIVSVCGDGTCSAPTINPGDCAVTPAKNLLANGAAFVCPCHGASYGASGNVLGGPATRALPTVAMRLDGADVLVDLSQSVSVDARTS